MNLTDYGIQNSSTVLTVLGAFWTVVGIVVWAKADTRYVKREEHAKAIDELKVADAKQRDNLHELRDAIQPQLMHLTEATGRLEGKMDAYFSK